MKFLRVLLALFLFSAGAVAQDINATLRGVVTDPSGAVVPNVTVQITNTEKGISRTVLTNRHGEYEAPQLAPQVYSITVSAPGFETQVRNDYSLQTAQDALLNFRLTLGTSTQQVVVTADASLLQSEDTSLGVVIDQKKIEELPQNGRNVFNLAYLAPNTNNGSVAGNPSENNNYTLDGVQNNDRTTGNYTLKPAEDSIQEFRIVTGQYSAEYGRQSGGQVLMTSKSGNNHFHGSAFDFIRNSVTDARNWNSTAPLPPFSQNQFGGTLGGPWKKNKLFFFASYEGERASKDTTSLDTLPTDQERNGDFSQLATASTPYPITVAGIGPTTNIHNQISPVSAALLNFLPHADDSTKLINNYTYNSVNSTTYDQYSIRVDYALSKTDAIYGSYNIYDTFTYTPGSVPLYGSTADARDQVVSLANDHTFSSHVINELRVGYNRWVAVDASTSNSIGDGIAQVGLPQGGPNQLPSTTSQTGGTPLISISSYTGWGTPSNDPQSRWDNTFNYIDSLTWTHGNHTFKFGTDIEHFYKHSFFVTYGTGSFSFDGSYTRNQAAGIPGNAIADFLLGNLRTTAYSTGDPNQHPKTTASGFYGQDQWKVRKNLTLNLGLRYEADIPQKESDNKLGTFDPTGTGTLLDGQNNRWSINSTGNLIRVGDSNLGDTIYKMPHLNFAPRVGFDYRFFSDKAVLRGGYGIYYDQLVVGNGQYQNYGLGPPYILLFNYTGTSSAPLNWTNPFPANTSAGGVSPYGINPNLPTPYRQQWSLGIQDEVAHNLLLEISYLGANGTHLPLNYNINIAEPGAGAIQPRTPFPLWGSVHWFNDVGTSSYHALTVRAERRYANGLSFLTFLTWSKSLDEGNPAYSGTSPQDFRNLKAEWGPSSFDQRLHYLLTVVDELPFGRGRAFFSKANPVVRNIIGGWEATAILTDVSGSPLNITSSVDISNTGTSNRPFQIGDPNLGAPHTRAKWFNTAAFTTVNPAGANVYAFGNTRRDSIFGPTDLTLDGGVFRTFRITEGISTQFRFEAFNALNHPGWSNPGTSVPAPGTISTTYGISSSAANTARQLQYAVKIKF